MAVPMGVGAALFLSELAPPKISDALTFVVELLAAVPSVIYGLLSVFVLVPLLREHVQPFLQKTLGWLPLFQGPIYGIGLLAASVTLAVMILPFIVVSRGVFAGRSAEQREAALAVGATRWVAAWMGVVPLPKLASSGRCFWPGARIGRNHGRDDGDWEFSRDPQVFVRARIFDRRRDRQ